MTRYFYTDPTAAAYMAKNFEMRFHADGWDEPTDATPEELATWGDAPIYVHPTSLHLLHPQDGDMVETPQSRVEGYYEQEGVKILKRNGIHFIYPESELI